MNKEELKKLKKELESRCISLTKFLINYCGIYTDNIHNINISHYDVKELMPNLKRISFENLLKYKNGLYTGEFIPVKDYHGNIVPYINPMLDIDISYEIDCEIEKEKEIQPTPLTDDLRAYELAKLCKLFKEHNKKREYRAAQKLLKQKKDSDSKQYKKKKNNLIMEGRGNNDEY